MPRVCAVSFTRAGRLYYLDPGPFSPRVGDKVLVPTPEGPEVAECVWAAQEVWDEPVGDLPVMAGPATEADLERDASSRRRRAEGRVAAKRLVREAGLAMKVLSVDYSHASGQFTVYFSAAERVDFRQLVRDLGRTLGARVELRQLSARDEARVLGGIGPCGRDLCCSTWLKDFEPVSVRMAKEQDLPLNPLKISGACGRLMCCLKYEHPLYQTFASLAPALGETVETEQGPGRVVGHDVPREQVKVRLADGGRTCACSLASVCGSRQDYEAAYGSKR